MSPPLQSNSVDEVAKNFFDKFIASAPISIRETQTQDRGELFMRKNPLIVIVAMLIGVNFVFTCSTSAHNIDLAKAREVIRNYARNVRDQSGGKYAHYSTSCVAAFPGHNHIARCVIDYKNEADTKKGVYTCRELIEVKLWAHDAGINYTPRGVHVSPPCGNVKLDWTVMQ